MTHLLSHMTEKPSQFIVIKKVKKVTTTDYVAEKCELVICNDHATTLSVHSTKQMSNIAEGM